ncbi:nephrin-like isoform X2 [Brevipalpus obovatus]|uniref:nephrin-like isoform X2 n=1 Tax=Brevipalpus obovatus TaxID=246614 RepID=UPI003D9F3DF5
MSTSSLSTANLILILLVTFFHLSSTGPANVYQVSGVVGGMAQLPCNITIPNKDDSIRLILWFRDNVKGGPIYSIDTRKSDLLKGKHFSSYESISLRASFDLNTNPAYLILDPLREEDISEYKCRVDFDKGPTLTTIVRLTVIVPPTNVFITNSLDQVVESVAGPYDGESNIELNCVSKGGVPLPSLTWYMNGEPIDDMYFSIEENKTVINQLTIFNVSRDHLKSVLMCTATNALYPSSFNATITLDLNLMPTYVKILPIKKSLVSGRSVDVVCESMYSRPPAVLTWVKNKRKLLDEREIIAENGNKTTSVLNLVPSPDDDGSYLICKAENIRLKNSVIEDRVQLSVYYPPVMTVYPITNNPSSIKEDGSVKLQCRAKSNPQVIEYSWYFDGKMISTSQTKYKWINQSVLSIDKVERADNGQYKCSGKNKIGYGESPEYTLRVNYSPICEPNQKTVYGIGLRETVRILCVVQAMPVEATFHWTMNGSQLPLHIKYPTNVEGLRSSLMYTPFTRQDYGSLQCWARNEAGSQEKPCIFHIVPADYPEPPANCSVSRVSDISMEIDCEPGYDGGLSQIFHLMVYRNDRSPSNLVYNLSSIDRPHFILHHLLPESYYFLDVYSSNIRGRSRDMSLLTSTTLTSEQLSLGCNIIIIFLSFLNSYISYIFWMPFLSQHPTASLLPSSLSSPTSLCLITVIFIPSYFNHHLFDLTCSMFLFLSMFVPSLHTSPFSLLQHPNPRKHNVWTSNPFNSYRESFPIFLGNPILFLFIHPSIHPYSYLSFSPFTLIFPLMNS